MRKSKSETALTREHIIATASQLFLTQGIAATGVADVMYAAGLTPGGFYRHFASKEQLVAEASVATFQGLIGQLAPAAADRPPAEAIEMIAAYYMRQLEPGAHTMCPLPSLGSELQHADEKVRAAAIAGHDGLIRMFASHTARLGMAEPELVASAVVSIIVGAVTLARLATDQAKVRAIVSSAQHAVHQLVHGRAEA